MAYHVPVSKQQILVVGGGFGGIKAALELSIPLMTILSDKKVKVIQNTAEAIDRKAHTLRLAGGEVLDYDVIILGLGVVTNYFGIPGMEDFSYSIKSFDAIKRFKEHLHNQIEDERRRDLNYVIVGAGATGIELAGALAE